MAERPKGPAPKPEPELELATIPPGPGELLVGLRKVGVDRYMLVSFRDGKRAEVGPEPLNVCALQLRQGFLQMLDSV